MEPFIAYSLPIQGFKPGIHQFEYEIDDEFFSHFEESPVQSGTVKVWLELDKRPEMMVFKFELTGKVGAVCDRCTSDIQLPVQSENYLVVKYSDHNENEDDEVVFIHRESPDFNVAVYIYEYIVLALPMIIAYDCENDAEPPCNYDVLGYLQEDSDDNIPGNPFSEALKGFSNDN